MAKAPRASAAAARGSEKLLQSVNLDLKELDLLSKISKRKGVSIVDWTVKGQPGPNWIDATFHIPHSQAGRIVTDILKLKKLRLRIEGNPYGTPTPVGISVRIRG